MTSKVVFRWHDGGSSWLVLDERGFEMMKIPNCGNLNRLLLGLDKDRDCVVDFPVLKVSEYKTREGGENMPGKDQVLVEYGMNVFGSHIFLGMQKATLDLEELHALQDIMMEAQAKWKAWNRARLDAKKPKS